MDKNKPSDFALFGGEPLFKKTLHVGEPNIGDRKALFERLNNILDKKWLTNNGAYVKEFERKIEALTGAKHCIAMCNGTVALEIAVRALGMKGEVIVPSFTFVATAHCLQWQEITPVFCDIDPETKTIDPGKIDSLITPKTTGIIGVHLWGKTCDTDSVSAIANKHDLRVLYDSSHAVGVSRNGVMVGNFGEAEVFSFHATKFVNSFEGGAICTNDDKLAEKTRLMKNFGFSGMDNVIYLGSNGKMSEPSAAMGLTSLESKEQFIRQNRENYFAYKQGIHELPGLELNEYDESELNNFQYIVLEVEEEEYGLTRDQLMEILHRENIRARRYFYPGVHNMEPYKSFYPNAHLVLPVTNEMCQKTLCLPTGMAVSVDQVKRLCELIQVIGDQSTHIRDHWCSA